MKSFIYKALLGIYRMLPFKRAICIFLTKTGILNNKFYKDLRFNGKFKVSDKKDFYLLNHDGSIENETFWKGLFVNWESDTGWIWQELCLFSNTILDIGANTGIYSIVDKSLYRVKTVSMSSTTHIIRIKQVLLSLRICTKIDRITT